MKEEHTRHMLSLSMMRKQVLTVVQFCTVVGTACLLRLAGPSQCSRLHVPPVSWNSVLRRTLPGPRSCSTKQRSWRQTARSS